MSPQPKHKQTDLEYTCGYTWSVVDRFNYCLKVIHSTGDPQAIHSLTWGQHVGRVKGRELSLPISFADLYTDH